MKPNESNEQDERVFVTGTTLSDGVSWYSSLVQQLRDFQEARRNPPPALQLTAAKDMSALDKLVDPPSAFASLKLQIQGLIDDTLHPHKIETTATPVEVAEIWSKQKSGRSQLVSVGAHIAVLILALIPWATASKPPAVMATNVMLVQP